MIEAPPLPDNCPANIKLKCESINTTCHAACSGLSLDEALPDGNWWLTRDVGNTQENAWRCLILTSTIGRTSGS